MSFTIPIWILWIVGSLGLVLALLLAAIIYVLITGEGIRLPW